MNPTPTASPTVTPEVAAFVEEVRARLADLSDDEREELLGGLEADLDEKVADGAPLGDPATYAEELRAAAGLPERTRRLPRPPLPRPAVVERWLNGSRRRFFAFVAAAPWRAQAWDVLRELRPVWWVARAWLLLTVVDINLGPWEPISLVPSFMLGDADVLVLLVAVVLSVLVGTGRLWPGSGPHRTVAARALLLAVNAAAVLSPVAWGVADWDRSYYDGGYDSYSAGYADAQREPGMRSNGRQVTNVFAYDAQGEPLSGVQLFDQDGRPLAVARHQACPTEVAGRGVLNVFPLQQRTPRGTCPSDATVPNHPLSVVPPVGLPEAEATPAPGQGKQEEGKNKDGAAKDGVKKQEDGARERRS